MNPLSIAISTDRLLESVYALSALHNIIHPAAARPPALHSDHRPALLRGMAAAVARTGAMLMPVMQGFDTDSQEIITLTFSLQRPLRTHESESLRRHIEAAVISLTLSGAYLNYHPDLSSTYAADADGSVKAARAILTAANDPASVSLTPVW